MQKKDALLALARALDKLILRLRHNPDAAQSICSFDFDDRERLNRAVINQLVIDAGLSDGEIITVEQRPHAGCQDPEEILHVADPFGGDLAITAWAPAGLGAYPCTPDRIAMLAACFEEWRDKCAEQLKVEPLASDPALSKAQQLALIALLELGAFEANARVTAAAIAAKAGGGPTDVNTFKRPLSGLTKLGLLSSHPGQAGGYWLKEAGVTLAEKLQRPLSQ